MRLQDREAFALPREELDRIAAYFAAPAYETLPRRRRRSR